MSSIAGVGSCGSQNNATDIKQARLIPRIVTNAAPLGLKNRPNNPLRIEPISGKNIILKYIIINLSLNR